MSTLLGHITLRNKSATPQKIMLTVEPGEEILVSGTVETKTFEMLPTVWEISGRCED